MAKWGSETGSIRLTVAGRLLIILVGLAVLAFVGWNYRDKLPFKAGAGKSTQARQDGGTQEGGPAARPGVLASVRESGTLRVGMEPDAAPLHFVNDRKQK